MKRIRNRKFLRAKRVQYSILVRAYRMSIESFRASMLESWKEIEDWQDAAMFEARVAAKLAENAYRKVVLVEGDISDFGLLKWARLAVEEELDG